MERKIWEMERGEINLHVHVNKVGQIANSKKEQEQL